MSELERWEDGCLTDGYPTCPVCPVCESECGTYYRDIATRIIIGCENCIEQVDAREVWN